MTNDIIKYEKTLRTADDFKIFKLDLKEFKREDLKSIKKLCFTVFYRHVNPENPTGNFVIKNCILEVE